MKFDFDKVGKQLSQKELPDWHSKLINDTRALVDMSRKSMGQHYAKWDRNNEVYRGYRKKDEQDKKAAERNEPEKMVVPVTYSQAQTFTAFCFALYTQREIFFELEGQNPNSHRAARIGEGLLQRDLNYNVFEAKLYQLLVDIARFGLAVTKTSWCRKTQKVREQVTTEPRSFLGINMPFTGGTQEVVTEKTKYLGNEIMSISPYRFFPDTRLPLTRFQDGEFCASEDEYSMQQLYDMQAGGYVFGVEHIQPMSKKTYNGRGESRLSNAFVPDPTNIPHTGKEDAQSGTVVITECQRVVVPSKFQISDEEDDVLDKNDAKPMKILIWYANDQRIIRLQPLGYLHDEFTYSLSQFSPDINDCEPMALADTIDQLQASITWFINARITSVRKVIQNYLVVDPDGIEIKDLQNRNPIIRLKTGMGSRGIDRFIKQLNVQDVTTGHLTDVKFLQEIIQITSGINDNMLGMFHTGRRSAREAGNVMANAANRLKMVAVLIFRMHLEPMGRQMLSNLRDGLDEETMVKLVGLDEAIESEFAGVTKSDLVGSYDFQVFDGTLPSEKSAAAEIFISLLEMFAKSPEAAIAIGIDPKACFREAMELRGVRNPERFLLQAQPQMPGQAPAVPGMPPQQQPQPQAQAQLPPPAGQQFAGF